MQQLKHPSIWPCSPQKRSTHGKYRRAIYKMRDSHGWNIFNHSGASWGGDVISKHGLSGISIISNHTTTSKNVESNHRLGRSRNWREHLDFVWLNQERMKENALRYLVWNFVLYSKPVLFLLVFPLSGMNKLITNYIRYNRPYQCFQNIVQVSLFSSNVNAREGDVT